MEKSGRKYVQARRVEKGLFTFLNMNDNIDFKTNEWNQIQLYIAPKWFAAVMRQNQFHVRVMNETEHEMIRPAGVGLSILDSEGAISKFNLEPVDDVRRSFNSRFLISGQSLARNSSILPNSLNSSDSSSSNSSKQSKMERQSYNRCKIATTIEERHADCKRDLSKDKTSFIYCKNNYCSHCCSFLVNPIKPTSAYNCQKECSSVFQQTNSTKVFAHCLVPPRPLRSIYSYCERNFRDNNELRECKLDFCHLCCVTSDQTLKTSTSDGIVEKCHSACEEKFQKNEEMFFKKNSLSVPLN